MHEVRISVVTPSYNQGQFIEETIRSVVEQRYPNMEYSVLDGGSTDRTIEILQKYDAQLSFWRSEKDRGQAAAINEGFRRATGDILCWLNSDDLHVGATLETVAGLLGPVPMSRWSCMEGARRLTTGRIGGRFVRRSRSAGSYSNWSTSWINRVFSGRGAHGSSSARSTRHCATASTGNGSSERARSADLSRSIGCYHVTVCMRLIKREPEAKSDGSNC